MKYFRAILIVLFLGFFAGPLFAFAEVVITDNPRVTVEEEDLVVSFNATVTDEETAPVFLFIEYDVASKGLDNLQQESEDYIIDPGASAQVRINIPLGSLEYETKYSAYIKRSDSADPLSNPISFTTPEEPFRGEVKIQAESNITQPSGIGSEIFNVSFVVLNTQPEIKPLSFVFGDTKANFKDVGIKSINQGDYKDFAAARRVSVGRAKYPDLRPNTEYFIAALEEGVEIKRFSVGQFPDTVFEEEVSQTANTEEETGESTEIGGTAAGSSSSTTSGVTGTGGLINPDDGTRVVAGDDFPTEFSTDPDGNFDGLVPDCEGSSCEFKHIVELVDNGINFIFFLIIPIAAIAFAYAGWMLMTSGGDTKKLQKARSMFGKIAIGIVIILVGWLLVTTILTALGVDSKYFFFDI